MAGGFGAGLAGLGGMFGGYQQAENTGEDIRTKKLKNQDLELEQQGQVIAGNTVRALQLLSQGGQRPGPPPPSPTPGQPSQPAAPPPMQGPPPGPPGGGMPPGAPGGPPGPPQAAMPQSGPPQGQPMPQRPPMPPPQPPGGGMQPPGGGQPPMQRPPGGQQRPAQGPLDLQTVLATAAKSNPGASPQALMAGVRALLPLMTADAQMQYREMNLNLREQALLSLEQQRGRTGDQRDRALDQGQQRADTGTEAQKTREDALAERERKDKATEDATGQRIQQADERIKVAQERETRLALKDKMTNDMQLRKLQAQYDMAAEKNDIAKQRTLLQAMHMRAQEVIGAWAQDSDYGKEHAPEILEENRKLFRSEIDNLGKPQPAPKDTGRVPPGSSIPGQPPAMQE